MRAMLLTRIASLTANDAPLDFATDWPVPSLGDGELLLRVSACGVCHTELDEIEGRTAPPRLPVIPGHQVVGHVAEVGKDVTRFQIGDRVGVGWIHSSSGDHQENISPRFRATGRDVHGGYAEYMTVPQDYAYAIPAIYTDAEAAPLLCAGAIGYRALRLTQIADGDGLGLTGFGGSAHLVLQMVRHRFPHSDVFVFARDPVEREFAKQWGAVWSGDITDRASRRLQAIIDTTPAWKPVVEALANLAPGGRLVINAIRKENVDQEDLLRLRYEEHLWLEREIKTVANITQHDIREFLPFAAEIPLRPEVTMYPLEEANRALLELKQGRVRGSKVLAIQ